SAGRVICWPVRVRRPKSTRCCARLQYRPASSAPPESPATRTSDLQGRRTRSVFDVVGRKSSATARRVVWPTAPSSMRPWSPDGYPVKIALLGGGGFRTPLTYSALLAIAPRVPISELVLYDPAED